MSLLLKAFRRGYLGDAFSFNLRRPRPKVSPRTIQKKKEAKRMKLVNKFSADSTGEKPLHSWLDAKKLKALAAGYQELRNTHRLSRKVDPKDSKEFFVKSENYSHIFVKKAILLKFSIKNGENKRFRYHNLKINNQKFMSILINYHIILKKN